jgi:hypothetical protein
LKKSRPKKEGAFWLREDFVFFLREIKTAVERIGLTENGNLNTFNLILGLFRRWQDEIEEK